MPQNSLVTNFLKISSFMFGRTKIFIHVWNYLRVNDRIFFFLVIISIDCALSLSVCSVLSNKHHFKLIDATLFIPEVGLYINRFRLRS